jgi:hypothetical protein
VGSGRIVAGRFEPASFFTDGGRTFMQFEAEIRIIRSDREALFSDVRACSDLLERRRAVRVAEEIARNQERAA